VLAKANSKLLDQARTAGGLAKPIAIYCSAQNSQRERPVAHLIDGWGDVILKHENVLDRTKLWPWVPTGPHTERAYSGVGHEQITAQGSVLPLGRRGGGQSLGLPSVTSHSVMDHNYEYSG
jgi:hypothetical protein